MDYEKCISGGLRAARAKARLSQAQVAEMIGVCPDSIKNWENRAGLSFENAYKLANCYGVSLDELADRKFQALREEL